ncbi:BrnA antitoxin family protein [Aureimonas glaciei]|jgi:uncharacterized protein (DUF4415 family)|uniref:BrnA antitoxin of type II toxin-antitoxin system n=1 Tax=Aureimonas glaciei TaxID=1776957 RepID=A0A916YF68_9HYPH|nr:BrnA antitoxin family protein [Aureimonas glaciei]GGD42165.1 hypothetical protein GCM10011335_51090 [Aureimonas glaciei]
MARPPERTRRPTDARSAAEAAFKQVTKKPERIDERTLVMPVPGARELVSLRIDADVLQHFQADGPGWQDRINQALRQAAGK